MKAFKIAILLTLIAFVSSAQTEEIKIERIRIKYQTAFSRLPEMYEIKFNDKTVDFIDPITTIPAGKEIKKTREFKKKEWNKLLLLIEKTNFSTIDSITEIGIDGATFSLNIFYSNGKTKKLEIWDGYAPDALKEIHRMLKKKK